MIINIPIESLEERYSAQWNKWFPSEFGRLRIEYRTIYPQPLTNKILNGSFLDVCGTNYFKAQQLSEIMKLLFDGEITNADTFLIHDFWFPGIEMLQYVKQGLGLDFKICGILHAGTYDPYDFVTKKGMANWGKLLEESWFCLVDKIFVATYYHKELITSSRQINPDKIIVTGLPIYYSDFEPERKPIRQDIVVFPHRIDSEKNHHLFDKLANRFKDTHWQFIKTKEVCQTKKEYYDLLAKSKIVISFSDQETWGIAQQEALALGCYPVVPNRLSYIEMYPAEFRYESFDDCLLIVDELMRKPDLYMQKRIDTYETLKSKGERAIENIIEEIRSLI